eukprot:525755_1
MAGTNMGHWLKTFLQRICMFAVYVTVVLHSFTVGVLGSEDRNESKAEEMLEKALHVLASMEDEQLTLETLAKAEKEKQAKDKTNEWDMTIADDWLKKIQKELKDLKFLQTVREEALKAIAALKKELKAKEDALQAKYGSGDGNASVWKNRGGGFLAGTIFGGVGALAGKYLLDDLNADAPTGSEDAGEGEISQDDLTISSGAVGVGYTTGFSVFLAILVPFGIVMFA